MAGVSRIFDIARRALAAQQMGLNVTGHNIANVNTPGYTRQRVMFEASKPAWTPDGMLGSGVSVMDVERIRNGFFDDRIRTEEQALGKWQLKEQVFQEVQNVFNEPSETGLSAVLSQFWDGWAALANDPQNGVYREQVRQYGTRLVDTMHNFESRLRVLQSTLNTELERTVDEFNTMLNQIATLNDKISAVEIQGTTANDYRDRRDSLLESLSAMADIRVVEHNNGMITVTLGGRVLVDRNSVTGLSTESTSTGSVLTTYPTWEGDGTEILVTDGKIKGLMEMRDESIEAQIHKLDEIALTLVSQLNSVHSGGYGLNGSTGINFFDSDTTGAADIALDANILADIAMIAASGDGSTGDGTIAQQISEVGESQIMSSNTVTINDYFASMMGSLGVAAQESQFMSENQGLVVQQLLNQRSSVSGVSLDEEMTNLIRFQHAYEAAARLVSVVDEMMETLIEMV